MNCIKSILIACMGVVFFSQIAAAQWFDDFKTLAEINAKLDDHVANYSNLVTPLVLGQSWENRDIRAIKIGAQSTSRAVKPAVVLHSTVHAREWVTPMTTMYAAEQLLSGYSSSSTIQNLLDEVDIFVVPVVNPDGYEYTWTNERLWRKNRRPLGGGEFGVDLNRNWDYGWGLDSGSSSSPSSNVYRGAAPFSEPETAAMRDFYEAHQNIVSNLDFHAYSQLILSPFGYSTVVPPDSEMINALANQMSQSIQSVHGEFYDPIAAHELYFASGISTDWVYGAEGAYSYTVELRPETFVPGFELPPDEILPTAEEAFAAILDIGQFTINVASGDFDNDGNYDCEDVAALGDAIINGTNKYEFDVDGSGVIDTVDVGAWLANAGANNLASGNSFLPGDANLDGLVDTNDFNDWNNNKFTTTSAWCDGDFNTDGVVDASDFNAWNQYKFASADGALVPEPGSYWALLLGVVLLTLRRRR